MLKHTLSRAAIIALALATLTGCVMPPSAPIAEPAEVETPLAQEETPEPSVEPTEEPEPESTYVSSNEPLTPEEAEEVTNADRGVPDEPSDEQAFLDRIDPVLAAEFGVPVSLMRSMPEYIEMSDSVLGFGYSTCGMTMETVEFVWESQGGFGLSWNVVQTAAEAAADHLC